MSEEEDAQDGVVPRLNFGLTHNKRILVADDDEASRIILKTFLERKGYEVFLASDGAEALEMIQIKKPAVVLLDIMMPLIDGIEVLRELKATGSKASVIMITGITDQATGKKALEMGAFDYITKPLELKYLEEVVWWKLQMME